MSRQTDLHAFLSPIQAETRLFKQARYVKSNCPALDVAVLGLAGVGLPTHENHTSGLRILRMAEVWAKLRQSQAVQRHRWLRMLLALSMLLAYGARFMGLSLRLRPQFITCHHLALLPLSVLASRITAATLVFAPHEWESERTGLTPKAQAVAKWIERHFIGAAHQHVFVCEPIRQWYADTYRLATTHVVRAIPEERLERAEAAAHRASLRQRMGIGLEDRVFIYQGLIDPARGTRELLQAFQASGCNAHLVMMGYGTDVDMVRQAGATCKRIHYIPAVPQADILKHTAMADAGLIAIKGPLSLSYQYSLPNKFFEYIMAGRPVFVTDNLRYVAELITKHGLGMTMADSEPLDLRKMEAIDLAPLADRASSYANSLDWTKECRPYQLIYGLVS